MILDVLRIVQHRHRFHAAQIFRRPYVQPLPHGHFRWFPVIIFVQSGYGFGHFLSDFLLCLGIDALASPWVNAGNKAGFPGAVLALAEGALAV